MCKDFAEEKEQDSAALKAFVGALKQSGAPRYGMVDYGKKVFFVSWIPDTGKV